MKKKDFFIQIHAFMSLFHYLDITVGQKLLLAENSDFFVCYIFWYFKAIFVCGKKACIGLAQDIKFA